MPTLIRMPSRALALLSVLVLAACAPAPLRTTLPSDWVPSPNFSERRPSMVVIHHTTNATAERAIATLVSPAAEVSAHYLIARDGRIVQLVDERLRAWHAGASSWGGNTDINSSSIGIELDNTGEEPFAEAQVAALLQLLEDLRARYRFGAAGVVGHGDIAPGRKVDPSHQFPWRRLAAAGFGLWCEPPYDAAPAGAGDALLLQAIGYETSDTGAAISAFRRHHRGIDARNAATDGLSEDERAHAQCVAFAARRRD